MNIDELVRDLTSIPPKPKSWVRAKLMELIEAAKNPHYEIFKVTDHTMNGYSEETKQFLRRITK